MKLKLTRPLSFFDLETTGLDIANDRIVSISIIKLLPDGTRIVKNRFINPGMPIPKEASDVHGITDEMVKNAPLFSKLAPGIYDFVKDSDLAGFNSNKFDAPLLYEEFARCGIDFPTKDTRLIDVKNIYTRQEPRDLTAAYKFYCGKDIGEKAHTSSRDVEVTVDSFFAQLEKYKHIHNNDKTIVEDFPKDIESLHNFSNFEKPIVDFAGKISTDKDGDYIYTFGKNKGQKIKKDTSFAGWMLKQDSFTQNTKKNLVRILQEIAQKSKTTA